ncbi:hypothetical protein GXM_09259 [Nostoc sphaeroides CCNUC1]|uniref:Uncharacterized protein n=1 Tax=Nostoc sphaeroides CCNUC1 TaxID=2653204 RepID=A0A5P8WG01_9NOSO|nr:hypothetical protein GXM_09259 [Nostoc sphaeroides CCNUC1]
MPLSPQGNAPDWRSLPNSTIPATAIADTYQTNRKTPL